MTEMDTPAPKPDLSALRLNKERDGRRQFSDRPKTPWLRWVVAVCILAALVLGYLLLNERVTPATQVELATVVQLGGSDASAQLVATGYVVAQRSAEVASKGTGRLAFLGFEEGDVVKSGQVIGSLENDDLVAAVDVAKALLKQAEVDSLNAGRDYRRRLDLKKSGSITQTELENAESRFLGSLAAVEGARAGLKSAQVGLENTYIRAPFSGTILTKNADVGEIVAPFASSASSKGSVVTLADMNSLEVEADVAESNIERVKLGGMTEIVLDAYPTARYPGRVKKIVPTADRSRATVQVKVAFDSLDSRVLPEMSARVNFFGEANPSSSATLLAVDKNVITTRDDIKVVFRLTGDRAEMVAVTLGRELGEKTEILSGLRAGDQVILTPAGKLATGQKIEVKN